ncbi:MAG: DUF3788 family protein [Bacteroidales bacterium]
MFASFFNNRFIIPDRSQFSTALGSTWSLFENLMDSLNNAYGGSSPEWKYYGPQSGWVLTAVLNTNNLFFVIPCNGYFKVAITFSQKAFDTFWDCVLLDVFEDQWRETSRCAESGTLQFDVKREADVVEVFRHIDFEMAGC